MIVVADASPLIFLAKVRQLALVDQLLGADVRVPCAVYAEVMVQDSDPAEQRALESFLAGCMIEEVMEPLSFASAMSAADNEALTLAVRAGADYLLCDERLTRTMAEAEGIRPLGTLGVLLRAMRTGIRSREATLEVVHLLVGTHGFRIGVGLYQAVLGEIGRDPSAQER